MHKSQVGLAQSVECLSQTVRQQQHDRSWFRAPPMPACKYVEENGLAAMLAGWQR